LSPECLREVDRTSPPDAGACHSFIYRGPFWMNKRKFLSLSVAHCAAILALVGSSAEFTPATAAAKARIELDSALVNNAPYAVSLVALNAATGLQKGQIYEIDAINLAQGSEFFDASFFNSDELLHIPALYETDEL